MGASIRAGVEGIAAATDAVLVCLADMPALRAAHVDALIDAFADAPPERICVPVHRDRRGHPVLFGAAHFPALCEIEGDRGARGILAAAAAHVREIDVSDDGILLDVDTLEDLARYGDS